MVLNHSRETDEISAFCIQFPGIQLTPQTFDIFCSDNTNFLPQTQRNTDITLKTHILPPSSKDRTVEIC